VAGELADFRAELLSRGARDEGVRNRLIQAGLGGSPEADAIAEEVEATDRANTEWLKEVLERQSGRCRRK
jgi:hypothetical protein